MDKRLFCFWTGDNKMTENRLRNLEKIKNITEMEVNLITKDNLNDWIIEPLHDGYQYLSSVHKSDYLRTYFMHFYGGCYCDIKDPRQSYLKAFNELNSNENMYINGYKELTPAYSCTPRIYYDSNIHDYENIDEIIHTRPGFDALVGNGAYIVRAKTPFTTEWYNNLIYVMDKKYDRLIKNPAKTHRDTYQGWGGNLYPFRWPELLGEIFHPLLYKYRNHVLQTLPQINCSNYR